MARGKGRVDGGDQIVAGSRRDVEMILKVKARSRKAPIGKRGARE